MSRPEITVLHSVGSWLERTQTWIYTQVACLPPFVESHIVCNNTQNLDQFHLANIHSLDREPIWRSVWDRAFRKLGYRNHLEFVLARAQAIGPDILHSHFGPLGWGNIEVVRRLGLKHVVSFYGFDVNYLPQSSKRWYQRYADLFQHVDLVLCEGPYMAASIEKLGCPSQKIGVHHLGVMLDRIPFHPRAWSPGNVLHVLLAASFREKKGLPYALEALGRIQHQVAIAVTIIGDANAKSAAEVKEKQKILDVIERHGLRSKVKMAGFQSHEVMLRQAYLHHIYLSPSVTAASGDTEGGAPVSIIEMAATGMPVVSTLHCDIPEVVQPGVTGLLARERDVDGLVSHMEWLIRHPDLWRPMVIKAREHVELRFSAQSQGVRLSQTYRDLVRKHT